MRSRVRGTPVATPHDVTVLARVASTIAPLLAGCALFAAPLAAPGLTQDSTVETVFQYVASAADDTSAAPIDLITAEEGTRRVDLYGNEVSDAVSTYRFDEAGSLYEVHSPQTELPMLASPES